MLQNNAAMRSSAVLTRGVLPPPSHPSRSHKPTVQHIAHLGWACAVLDVQAWQPLTALLGALRQFDQSVFVAEDLTQLWLVHMWLEVGQRGAPAMMRAASRPLQWVVAGCMSAGQCLLAGDDQLACRA